VEILWQHALESNAEILMDEIARILSNECITCCHLARANTCALLLYSREGIKVAVGV
jgi:hypothetical protein